MVLLGCVGFDIENTSLLGLIERLSEERKTLPICMEPGGSWDVDSEFSANDMAQVRRVCRFQGGQHRVFQEEAR